VEEAELDAIAVDEIDVTSGEEEGPLAFDAIVEVRPKASIAGYQGLVVTIPSPLPTDEEVDAQVDRLREQFGTLVDVERPAKSGDHVTLDVNGLRNGAPLEELTSTDLVYEVGSEGLVDGADEAITGSKVGDIVEVEAGELPGGPATLRILVKQVREKELPVADDAFAADASEFATIAELREDIRTRLTEIKRFQARLAMREKTNEALLELVDEEAPKPLVAEELERQTNAFARRLAQQGTTIERYLAVTGQDPATISAELERAAVSAVKIDLGLRALAEAESIEVSDEDVAERVEQYAEASADPADVRAAFDREPGRTRLRSELRNEKAAAWLLDHVELVDEQGEPVDRAELVVPEPPADAESAGEESAGPETEEVGS
jgi:trigger factor